MKKYLQIFALDLRSLALFRISLGMCLFVDVFYRLFYINDFYSDFGVLPRAAALEHFLGPWEYSVFLMTGKSELVFVLMALTLVAIAMMTVGYRTRLAAFVTWVLVTSLQTRTQIVLHGGDDLIRVLLFWCQFVPLGAAFSVDRYLNPSREPADRSLLSFGGAGLMLQLIFMYAFTAALKVHPVWVSEGSAIYYALSLEQFTDTLGQWLLNFPVAMRFLTFSTLLLEAVGPLLLLIPGIQQYVRLPIVLSFIGFHFGLFLTLHLGPFPWTCMAAWLMFLPPQFWDAVANRWSWSPIEKISLYFKKYKLSGEKVIVFYPKAMQYTAALFIGLVFLWNLSHHESLPLHKPDSLRIVMNLTKMYQKWNMFAPYPRKDDGWYVIEAKLLNGETVDPLAEDFIYTEEKPNDVAATYVNTMWRKYLSNMWLRTNYQYRIYFGRYLCRRWNLNKTQHDEKINTMKISYMLQMTPAPGAEPELTKKELLWKHYCFDKPADWSEN
jgi:Vitamin K-dependent gamma-carboxylase